MTTALKQKNVVLAVSGGIAAYKAVELLRLLVKAGAETRVVMTRNATHFVGPLTFEALSGRKVCLDLYDPYEAAGATITASASSAFPCAATWLI